MKEWNGEDRRKANRDDHDLLTKIDANLSNFMRRFDEHVSLDEIHLERLYRKTSAIQKYFWMSLGGGSVLVFIVEKFFR